MSILCHACPSWPFAAPPVPLILQMRVVQALHVVSNTASELPGAHPFCWMGTQKGLSLVYLHSAVYCAVQ